jgi:hypothetical protein
LRSAPGNAASRCHAQLPSHTSVHVYSHTCVPGVVP